MDTAEIIKAARDGDLNLVKQLLDDGADINAVNGSGASAHSAAPMPGPASSRSSAAAVATGSITKCKCNHDDCSTKK